MIEHMNPIPPARHSRALRIAIDCRIPEARQGHGAAIRYLACALSSLHESSQRYTFLVGEDLRDWMTPYLSGPCDLAVVPGTFTPAWKEALRSWPLLGKLGNYLPRTIPPVPVSDGYVERQGFDLVHFPTQQAYLTSLPSVYQPWDLQHVHYPQFFSARDLTIRDLWYRAFCRQASAVCVQAEWTRNDLIASYAVPAQKIAVVPWGSPFEAYTAPSIEVRQATKRKFQLPQQFLIYPAVTWPHKNHAVLLRALALLKDEHQCKIPLYLTGAATAAQAELKQLTIALGIADQVHWLGFVSSDELQSLFATATALVFPSLFEGFGLPILEAFQSRLPVLSSNATVLPEIAQEGALYFDPTSEQSLATQILNVLNTTELPRELQAKGTEVLKRFTMSRTASALHELYGAAASGTWTKDVGDNPHPAAVQYPLYN